MKAFRPGQQPFAESPWSPPIFLLAPAHQFLVMPSSHPPSTIDQGSRSHQQISGPLGKAVSAEPSRQGRIRYRPQFDPSQSAPIYRD
jgi:hypothetical protein